MSVASITPTGTGTFVSTGNVPEWTPFGFAPEVTKTGAEPAADEMSNIFGPHTDTLLGTNRQNIPRDQQTLQSAFAGAKAYLMTIVRTNFELADGWEFRFAPRQRAPAMSYEWSSVKVSKAMLNPEPEGTAPEVVNYQAETHYGSLARFGLGAREFHDFLKTAQGRSVWLMKLAAISSAAIICAKVMVARTVISSKSKFAEHMRASGRTFGSVEEAVSRETSTFAAFHDPLGVFKLNSIIMDLIRYNADIEMNMAVVPHGTFGFLAWNSPKLVTASEVGEARVERILTLGSRAMANVLPGIELFEHKPWRLQNLSEEELDQFQRLTTISCYGMISSDDAGDSQVGPHFDPAKLLSVQLRDIEGGDGWTTIKVDSNLLDASQRWAEDGTLSRHHMGLIRNLGQILQRMGVSTIPGLVDPYIVRNQDMPVVEGSMIQTGEGYYPIANWGDQDTRHRSLEFDETYGRHYRARVEHHLTPKEIDALDELVELTTLLRDVDNLDDLGLLSFLTATAADPKGHKGAAWTDHPSSYLQRDAYGAPSLPRVERNLTSRHQNDASRAKVFNPSNQAEDLKGRGAVFVLNEKGVRLYPWLMRADESKDFNFGLAEKQFHAANGSPAAVASEAAFAARFDTGAFKIPAALRDPNIVESVEPAVALTYDSKQVGFGSDYGIVWAPFGKFGPVDSDGAAYQWNHHIPTDSEYRSKEFKFLDSVKAAKGLGLVAVRGAGADIAAVLAPNSGVLAWDAMGKAGMQGFLPPKLIPAPTYPYGFSGPNGLMALAQHSVNGDMRGWDTGTGEVQVGMVARRGMAAMKKLWKFEKSIHPESDLHDAGRAPYFMRSENRELDEMYAMLSIAWEEKAVQPTWVKIPVPDADLGNAPLFKFEDVLTGKVPDAMRGGIAPIADLALDAGARPPPPARPPLAAGVNAVDSRGADLGVTKATFETELAAVLASDQLEPSILEAFSVRADAKKIFDAYADSPLSDTYSEMLKERERDATPRTDFAWFFVEEVVRRSRTLDEKASTFAGIVGMIMADERKMLRERDLTWDKVGSLRRGAPARRGTTGRKRKAEEDAVAVIGPSVSRAHPYVCTRLVLSNSFWQTASGRLETKEDRAALLKLPIRPTNPLRPREPLASKLFASDDKWDPAGWVGDAPPEEGARAIDSFQYARGHWDSHGGFAFLGASTNPLDQPPPSTDASGFSALDEGGTHPNIYQDPQGPFYTTKIYTEQGRASPEEKSYFISRYKNANSGNRSRVERFGMNGFIFCRVTKGSILAMMKERVCPPTMSWILLRPFIQFFMDAALWAQGGSQTSRLLFDWADMAFQYQGTTKKWFVHFTIWLDCAIFDPTKLVLWTDTKFSQYLGGMSTDLIVDALHWDPTDVDFDKIGSVFAFDLCGDSFTRSYALKYANPLSIFGHFDKRMFNYNLTTDFGRRLAKPTMNTPSSAFYEYVWNLLSMNPMPVWKETSFSQKKKKTVFHGMAFKEKERVWDHVSKRYVTTDEARGTGHLANWEPPLKDVFNGLTRFSPASVETK